MEFLYRSHEMILNKIIRPVIRSFYTISLAIAGGLLCWILQLRKKKVAGNQLNLRYFNPAGADEKKQLFVEWCCKKEIGERRCDVDELEDYAVNLNLPTFNEWKEIHGHSKFDWVSRDLYMEWVKFIGGYDPKFDPLHPDWDGR